MVEEPETKSQAPTPIIQNCSGSGPTACSGSGPTARFKVVEVIC